MQFTDKTAKGYYYTLSSDTDNEYFKIISDILTKYLSYNLLIYDIDLLKKPISVNLKDLCFTFASFIDIRKAISFINGCTTIEITDIEDANEEKAVSMYLKIEL